MAEINFNNLYNQLSPMDKMFYDQQFQKSYNPNEENLRLSGQENYDQMKAVYDAQQQVPEKSFLDKITNLFGFGSASAAEMPQVPNLTYRNIDLPFDLRTGITNTKAALPFKINVSEILNKYNVPNSGSQDLVDQIIEENQMKANPFDPRNFQSIFPTNVQTGIRQQAPLQNLGIDTSYGVANEEDVEQVDSLTGEKKSSGIMDLIMSIALPGYGFLKNMASKGQPYQQFTPGGTIRNGIYSIDGVNVPVSSFGGDFYNPNTGLNRFDRAAQRYAKTGSALDLFGSSRTGKEFFEKLRERKAAKQKALEDAAKKKRNISEFTSGGGGESLSSIGKSTFSGPGMAFEKKSGGSSGVKGTSSERNYGGR